MFHTCIHRLSWPNDFQDFRTESLTTGTSAAFKPPASPQKAWQIASGHFSATSAQDFCIVTAQVCTSLFWWCTATVLMASSELMLSLTRAFVQSRFHAHLNCKCQDYCKGNASMAEIPLANNVDSVNVNAVMDEPSLSQHLHDTESEEPSKSHPSAAWPQSGIQGAKSFDRFFGAMALRANSGRAKAATWTSWE